MAFFVLFLRKYPLQFICCLLCYLLMKESVQTAVHICSSKQVFLKISQYSTVHYTFPKFYLMIDNWYFRVIFYYCQIRPCNRKNFAIDWSKFLVERWFKLLQREATTLKLNNLGFTFIPEAVTCRCSVEKVLLKISQNSQENTCAGVSFLIKLQVTGLQLY